MWRGDVFAISDCLVIVCNYMNYGRYNCTQFVNKLLVYLFVIVLFICSTVNNFTPRGLQIGLALLGQWIHFVE